MSENSPIEWTHHTFNPWWGCAKVSPGCDHCYAEAVAKRYWPKHDLWNARDPIRRMFDHKHWREPYRWNHKAEEAAERRRVFCASMADVFDGAVDLSEERGELWTLIHKTPHLDWLLLTKRVGNVARMVPESWMKLGFPPNVWLGISVVDRDEWARDVPKLRALPAKVRFISGEPLLADLGQLDLTGIHWVIVGGESGHGARPFNTEWAASILGQCRTAGVPCFIKQLGANVVQDGEHRTKRHTKGGDMSEWPHEIRVREFPKP